MKKGCYQIGMLTLIMDQITEQDLPSLNLPSQVNREKWSYFNAENALKVGLRVLDLKQHLDLTD